MAGLFQILWGQADRTFKKAAVLNGTDGRPLIIPAKGEEEIIESICTRPTAVDWNGDGKLDLVVGTFAGTFYVFSGEGKGRFRPAALPVLRDGATLKLDGAHGDPFVVDWDGDGDLDLLSGSDRGGVQWAENTAGKGTTPKLKSFRPILKPGTERRSGALLDEKDLTEPDSSLRIWVDDLNGDGKLDILVGDNVTLVSPAKGVSREQFTARHAVWEKKFAVAGKALGNGSRDQKAVEQWRKIYEEREAFMHEERTGYVWLYLQK